MARTLSATRHGEGPPSPRFTEEDGGVQRARVLPRTYKTWHLVTLVTLVFETLSVHFQSWLAPWLPQLPNRVRVPGPETWSLDASILGGHNCPRTIP